MCKVRLYFCWKTFTTLKATFKFYYSQEIKKMNFAPINYCISNRYCFHYVSGNAIVLTLMRIIQASRVIQEKND